MAGREAPRLRYQHDRAERREAEAEDRRLRRRRCAVKRQEERRDRKRQEDEDERAQDEALVTGAVLTSVRRRRMDQSGYESGDALAGNHEVGTPRADSPFAQDDRPNDIGIPGLNER